MVPRPLWSQTSHSREGLGRLGTEGEEPQGRVSRPHPLPSQRRAEQASGEGAGAQRANSCDHRAGIFLATRLAKGDQSVFSDRNEKEALQAGESPARSPSF